MKHNCPFCDEDKECPGEHCLIDYINMDDQQLKEVGLMRIPKEDLVWKNQIIQVCRNCNKRYPDHKNNCDYDYNI